MADDWQHDRRPVRRIQRAEDAPVDWSSWPVTVPAVQQLLADGLDLAPGVTFLVGENGSGKSTLVEAVADAYGLGPRAAPRTAGTRPGHRSHRWPPGCS